MPNRELERFVATAEDGREFTIVVRQEYKEWGESRVKKFVRIKGRGFDN